MGAAVGDAVGADVGDWNTTRAFGFPIGWAWSSQKPCGTVRVYGKAASSTFAVIVYLWFPAVSSRNHLHSVIDNTDRVVGSPKYVLWICEALCFKSKV